MWVAVLYLACLRENPNISEKGIHNTKEHVPDAEYLGDLYQVRVLGS